MASSVRITNKLPSFAKSLYSVLDDAISEGAKDTLIDAKMNAPFDKGNLRAASAAKQIRQLLHRVSFWEEYARFQEFGGDGKRRVRNYTTSGTGAHFLRNAGDRQHKKIVGLARKHGLRARA